MVNTEAIKKFAKMRGKKVGEICRELGYHPNKLSDVAKGRASFTDRDIVNIAKILDITPEDILDKQALDGSIAERLFDPDVIYESLAIDVKVVGDVTYITMTAEENDKEIASSGRKRVSIRCKNIKCSVDTNPKIQ